MLQKWLSSVNIAFLIRGLDFYNLLSMVDSIAQPTQSESIMYQLQIPSEIIEMFLQKSKLQLVTNETTTPVIFIIVCHCSELAKY